MKISKIYLVVTLAIVTFIGCKNTDSKAPKLKETVAKKEIAVAVQPETASFHIEGMTCAIGCAKTIEEKLSEMEGVQNAKVDFDKKEAIVNFDLDKLTATDLVKVVQATGDGKTYKVSGLKTANKA